MRSSRSFLAATLIASFSSTTLAEVAPAPAKTPEAPAKSEPAKAPEPSPEERARALFKEGRDLAKRGEWDGACSKFQQSLALEKGIGTQFNLADCLEHRGKTASARALFIEVAERARAEGQGDRERVARARAAELEGRVPSLVIEVAFPAREEQVSRDGTPLPAAAFGAALPVDPGPVVISAAAPGRSPWSTRLDLPATGASVQVLVPRLEDEKKGAAIPAVVPVETPHQKAAPKKLERKPVEPPEVPPEPDEKKAPSRILPIALLAGAGAGAVLGAATYVLYRRNNSEAQDVCRTGANCTQAQVDHHESLIDDARTMRTVSFIGFGVAGAALITAGVLTLTGRHNRESPAPPPVAASAFVGREGFAAGLSGRF